MKDIILALRQLLQRFIRDSAKIMVALLGWRLFVRYTDITRIKSASRQETQRHMYNFLNVVSHNIKTPLTGIKGNIQLVTRRLKKYGATTSDQSEETRRFLQELREILLRTDQQINRLTQFVNGLLESSRIHVNTMELLFDLYELQDVLKQITCDERHVPPGRQVQVELPGDKALLVMMDVDRIKQVLHQFISNAHKFSRPEHPITLLLEEHGQVARVLIQDKGQGIPKEEHQKIWEQFYRVPHIKILNGNEVGLGLGLYVCRTIIERHRGQVGVKSKQGEGSTFWFTLPLVQQGGRM